MHFKPLCLKFVQHLKGANCCRCGMCQLKFAIIISLHERAACINTTEYRPKQAGMQSGQQKKYERKKENHSFTSNKNIMKCQLTKCNITVQPCNQPWMVKLKKGKRKLFVHRILRCKTDTSLPCIKEYKTQHCKYSVKRKEGQSWTKQNEGYESVSNRSSRWKTDIQKTGEIE